MADLAHAMVDHLVDTAPISTSPLELNFSPLVPPPPFWAPPCDKPIPIVNPRRTLSFLDPIVSVPPPGASSGSTPAQPFAESPLLLTYKPLVPSRPRADSTVLVASPSLPKISPAVAFTTPLVPPLLLKNEALVSQPLVASSAIPQNQDNFQPSRHPTSRTPWSLRAELGGSTPPQHPAFRAPSWRIRAEVGSAPKTPPTFWSSMSAVAENPVRPRFR